MLLNPMQAVEGIVLIFAGIVCLILTILQYYGKGPVLSAAYFTADAEIKEKIRTKKTYRNTAIVLLYPSIVCIFFGISFIFNQSLFSYLASILLLQGILSAVIFVLIKNR